MSTFDFLKNVEPEKILDVNEFEPIKGAYIARIEALEHQIGTSERTGNDYDFYSLKLQVKETKEGDKGDNRYLDKIYSNDERGIIKLRDEMFTAGLTNILNFESNEELDKTLHLIKDKLVKIRAWNPPRVKKNEDGEWVVPDKEDKVQRLKIVAELELKGQQGSNKSSDSNTPF